MIRRLPEPDERENPDPRGDLDSTLMIATWKIPGEPPAIHDDIPTGAPSWWHGETEASESFMRSMGIVIDPQTGEVVKR